MSEETSKENPEQRPRPLTRLLFIMLSPPVGGAFLLLIPGRYGILMCLATLTASMLTLLSFKQKIFTKILVTLLAAAYLAIGITTFIIIGNNT